MNNVVEAVRYGVETLGVSPDEMFSLIKSSEGYEGGDYRRWLASKIIELCESLGVGYTQLLVKKFAITQSIIESYSDNHIKDSLILKMKDLMLNDSDNSLYTMNMEDLNADIVDTDWFNGIDMNSENSEFVSELPDDFREDFLNDKVSLVYRVSSDGADRGSDLYSDARNTGLSCKSAGALMLYRVCQMVSAFDECTENFRFGILTSTKFLCDRDNEDIWNYFLQYFDYSGFAMSAGDLMNASYMKCDYAFLVCTPKTVESKSSNGIILPYYSGDTVVEYRRYSRSIRDMYDALLNMEPSGKFLGTLSKESRGTSLVITSERSEDGIEITENNLRDVIVYYAVSKSLEGFGLSNRVFELLTGSEDYMELFYNCLPLFLFDTGNKCKSVEELTISGYVNNPNLLSEDNPVIKKMLEDGEEYYSFESKQLLDICSGFMKYLRETMHCNTKGKTFEEIREICNYPVLNNQYMSAVTNLKDFISTLYRKIE